MATRTRRFVVGLDRLAHPFTQAHLTMSGPFDIDCSPPTAELLEVAKNELRETPEVRAAAIEELRKLLKASDLSFPDDDEFLLIYLRPTKFYPESALKLMRNVAEFNKTHKDLLHNLMPADCKDVFVEHGLINIFTNRDQSGRRLMVVHMGELWNTKQVTEDQIFRALYTIQKLAVLEAATQINGAVVIYDFKGMGMGHVSAMSTSGAKRLLTFIQEACPLRMKAVHFVNEPMIFNMVWKLFKPFVKEKLNKRMFFHGEKMAKLHEHIHKEFLPANYGGSLPALTYGGKDWYPAAEKHIDFIKKWNTCGFK
ncbi:retinaldehyde-binding protein 1-like [Anopheles darlingi]|uniref:retinaldehyde-binding protein 1-like n=1 Tax=Anopheles darlingi TaxID=43151 RepID=UPI00210009D6|nr:retinaldehyde-binding protein 1-like [Anopheles darlingi]